MLLITEKKVRVKLKPEVAKSLRVRDRRTGKMWTFTPEVEQLVPMSFAYQMLSGNWFTVDPDPLKDYSLVAKHTGTFGDTVCEAHCLQSYNYCHSEENIIHLISTTYSSLASKIAPDIDIGCLVGTGKHFVDFFTEAICGKPSNNRNGFAWEREFAKAVGFEEYPQPTFPITFTEKELMRPQQLIPRKRPKLVVLHLWSNHARSKSIDPKRVSDLVEKIQKMNCDVTIIGGSSDPKFDVDRNITLMGKLSIVEAAATISLADAVVSIDSWVWHMAKLLLKPQVVMFGSTKCAGEPKWWEMVRVLSGYLPPQHEHPDAFQTSDCSIIDSIQFEEVQSALKDVMEEADERQRDIQEELFQNNHRELSFSSPSSAGRGDSSQVPPLVSSVEVFQD